MTFLGVEMPARVSEAKKRRIEALLRSNVTQEAIVAREGVSRRQVARYRSNLRLFDCVTPPENGSIVRKRVVEGDIEAVSSD